MEKRRRWNLLGRFKSLELSLERAGFVLNGQPVPKGDCARLANAYILWGLITLDIGVAWDQTRVLSEQNITRWLCQLRTTDVTLVVSTLKSVLAFVRSECQRIRLSSKRLHRFLKEIDSASVIGPMKTLLYLWTETDSPDLFRDINTFLQFFSRLTLRDNESLDEDAVQKYILFEDKLKNQQYDDVLCQELRQVVNDLFGDWTLGDAQPHFSSGATAEVRRGGGVGKKVQAPIAWGPYQLFLRQDSLNRLTDFSSAPLPYSEAVYQTVPKGIDKRRGISMEPAYTQYGQQAVFESFDRYCRMHPRARINLHDQSLNRSLALEGSRTLKFATIDESDASDSVTLTLIKKVCCDLPVYPALIRTRSSRVRLPDKSVLLIEKFAPMGSACCFPIECLIFSAIVELARRHIGSYHPYRVYGDDIVCSSDVFGEVVKLLEAFGFTVNRDKSFSYSRFTESCGIEAFDGFDVTPLRLSRRYDVVKLRQGTSAQQFLGSIDLCNRLLWTSYFMTRKYLIADHLRIYPETYFTDLLGEYGLKSLGTDLNYHLKTRCQFAKSNKLDKWAKPMLQRVEYRCLMPKACEKRCRDDIRYALTLQELEATERQYLDESTVIEVKAGPTTISLRKRWYPGYLSPQDSAVLDVVRGRYS